MSLFERLQDKRFNLQEKKVKKSFPSGSFDPANQEGKFVKNEAEKNLNQKKDSLENTLNQNTKQNTSDRKLEQAKQQERINKQYDMGDGSSIGTPQDQTYKSSSNQKPKNKTPLKRGFEDVTKERIQQQDIPKTKAELLKKRQEYGITYDDKLKKTTITKDGLEKFTRRSLNKKQIDSGSNEPIKLTKADLDKARERVIGGRQIKDSKGNIIGTTTGKYGGNVSGDKTYSQKTQQPQSNARKNMNRTLNFKNFRQKLKNLSSKATEKLSKIKTSFSKKSSNFQKGLKDPTRGFAPYKSGKRAIAGNVFRKRGIIGDVALATAIAYPFIQDARARKKDKEAGKAPTERISSKNTTDTGPLYSTKTGKDIKFGFNASGKAPQGTVGSMFNKKVKSMVQSKLDTKEFDFRKKVT